MRCILAFVAGVVFSSIGLAQHWVPDVTYIGPDGSLVEGVRCATVDTAPPGVLKAPLDKEQWWIENGHRFSGTVYIPVAFHIITAANGTGDVPDERIQRQIDTLNAA